MHFYSFTEALQLKKHFESLRLRLVTVTPAAFAIIINGQWQLGYYVNLYLDTGEHITPYQLTGGSRAIHEAYNF